MPRHNHGFTHICGKTRAGRFALRRKTIAKKMTAKLREVNALLMQRRHWPIPEQGQWLGSVVRGHIAYYAVPGNIHAVSAFRKQVTRHWDRALRRRSQRHRVTWERMGRLEARWLLPPGSRIPGRTSDSTPVPKVGAQCASSARWDLCGGPPALGRSLPRMYLVGPVAGMLIAVGFAYVLRGRISTAGTGRPASRR